MKILFVITSSNIGGAQKYLYYLAKNLSNKKYEIHIATNPKGDYYFKYKSVADKIIDIKNLTRNFNLTKDLKALFKLNKLISKENYDIINTHTAKASFLGVLVAKNNKVDNIFFSAHGYNSAHIEMNIFKDKIYSLLKKLIVKLSKKTIVVSENTKRKLLKKNICNRDKIEVIHGGVNLDKFQIDFSKDYNNKKLIIGAAGRFIKLKGFEYYIDATKMVISKNNNINFLLAGDGPNKNKYIKKINNLNIDNKIELLPFQNKFEDFLKKIDILVVPSLMEGFPLTPCESLAMGVPVIATTVGGLPEVFEDGIHGYYVKPKSSEEIANKILKLDKHRDILTKMSEKAIKFAKEKYDWKSIVEKHENIFVGEK